MFLLLGLAASAALIGFDIGSETIKAAVLRSGRSIEMVLNEQSKRKTPGFVAIESDSPITADNVRQVKRAVGVAAQNVLMRNSSAVVRAFPEILGKVWGEELQERFNTRHLDFQMDGTRVNGVEPHVALAMLFEKLAKSAERQLQEGAIRDAVVAVPAYFTNVQRKKVAAAVRLAGLNLLEIIDEKHALSLVYAVEKTSFFTREPKTVAIVDFGHGSLTISGFKFSAKIVTQKGRNPKPVPKIEEFGYVWDDGTGGVDFDVALAEFLAKKYGKTVSCALLEDAQKLKHALTLNDPANVSMDSLDQRVIMTRQEFHDICGAIFGRIRELAETMNQTFDSVEFVGGASRIPEVQSIIGGVLGNAIGRSLNGDESVVTGAAYTAAISSGAFKLMDVTHDATSAHAANLTFGEKEVRLFSQGSSMSKLKTARFDATGASNVMLKYASKVPVGCEKVIYEWQVVHDGEYPPVSRIALSFGFNKKTAIELSKSLLFTKKESGEITQTPLDVKLTRNPMKCTREERAAQRALITAFTGNDARLAKVAEARNNLESLIFELRDAINRDPVWLKVTSEQEKVDVNKAVNETAEWAEENHNLEDEAEIRERTRLLEDAVKTIKYRVQESRTRESSVQELEYLLKDMQEAVLVRWPAKKLRVPQQQKKAMLNHVKLTREWLDRKLEEQNGLDPWDDPVLKTGDLEIRIKKLGDAYKNLEEAVMLNRLKNRRDQDDEDEFGADL